MRRGKRSFAGCPNRAADGAPLAGGRFGRASAPRDGSKGIKPLHSLYTSIEAYSVEV